MVETGRGTRPALRQYQAGRKNRPTDRSQSRLQFGTNPAGQNQTQRMASCWIAAYPRLIVGPKAKTLRPDVRCGKGRLQKAAGRQISDERSHHGQSHSGPAFCIILKRRNENRPAELTLANFRRTLETTMPTGFDEAFRRVKELITLLPDCILIQ